MKLDVKPLMLPVQPNSQAELTPSTWVQLLELPHPFSFDEALLLCQQSEEEWVAWIPDRGEVVLHSSQFCRVD
ncbi:MAG: hypothetical protein ACM37W_04720 [Actinomycetota bacterium]